LLPDFKVTNKVALFFGTEQDGLCEEVLKKADGFLKIPMKGFTESLNISVAAAIILQHISNLYSCQMKTRVFVSFFFPLTTQRKNKFVKIFAF